MRILTVLIVYAVISLTPVQAATWVAFPPGGEEGAPPTVNVLSSDADHTVVEVTIPGMWVEDIEIEADVYQYIEIPGYVNTENVGLPALPFISEMIAIPGTKDVGLNILDTDSYTLEGYHIFPTQKPLAGDEEWEFVIDDGFYSSAGFFPEETLAYAGAALWRDLRVTAPGFLLVRYYPALDEIEVTYYFKYELVYEDVSYDNTQEDPTYAIEQDYAEMYGQNIINYDFLNLPETGWDLGDRDYLIITAPEFVTTLNPFKGWLNKHGFSCFVQRVDEIPKIPGRPTSYNIWKYIYKTCEGYGILKYVLLVGDFEDIPPFIYPREYPEEYWWMPPYKVVPSDHYYACVKGSDSIPDISVGRIPGHSPSLLSDIINQIIDYKNGVEPGVWAPNVLLVAHRGSVPIPGFSFEQCKDDIAGWPYKGSPLPSFEKKYGKTNRNSDLTASIDQGRYVVNYKGHGNYSAWANWSYSGDSWTSSDIANLNNGDKTPVVYSSSCSNADLYHSCIADDWLNYGAAVASIGATTTSILRPAGYLDRFFFRNAYPEKGGPLGRPVGIALDLAKCDEIKTCAWVRDDYSYVLPGGSRDTIRMYILLGDPSLNIRRGSLTSCSVNHESSVALGASTIHVEVLNAALAPVENAVVCLYKEGEVHEAHTTAADGLISFDIETDTVGEITVTANKEGFVPYEGIITVEE